MMTFITHFLLERAHAQNTLQVTGFGIEEGSNPTVTIGSLVNNVLSVANGTIGVVCTAIFIIGAFFLATSAGDDQRKSLGIDLMKGAARAPSPFVHCVH